MKASSAQMADADREWIKALLQTVHSSDDAVNALFEQVAGPRLRASLNPFQGQETEITPELADRLQANCTPHKARFGISVPTA